MFKFTTDVSKIRADIDKINTAGAALDELTHETAVNCLNHAKEHGDVTLCSRLVQAMPRSARTKALIHWFTTFGPLEYHRKDGNFQVAKGKRGAKAYEVEQAIEHPFFDYTKERDPVPFSIQRLIASVTRQIEKAKEKGEVVQADVELLQKHVATLHA